MLHAPSPSLRGAGRWGSPHWSQVRLSQVRERHFAPLQAMARESQGQIRTDAVALAVARRGKAVHRAARPWQLRQPIGTSALFKTLALPLPQAV
jgi:hypothetical protein